jgi:hypothetical protein
MRERIDCLDTPDEIALFRETNPLGLFVGRHTVPPGSVLTP